MRRDRGYTGLVQDMIFFHLLKIILLPTPLVSRQMTSRPVRIPLKFPSGNGMCKARSLRFPVGPTGDLSHRSRQPDGFHDPPLWCQLFCNRREYHQPQRDHRNPGRGDYRGRSVPARVVREYVCSRSEFGELYLVHFGKRGESIRTGNVPTLL